MGGCYIVFGEVENTYKIVVKNQEGKRDHLESVFVVGTIVLEGLADAEDDNDHTDRWKYQRELC